MSARTHAAPSFFRSLLTGLACALVLGLGLLAHAPAAHAWLHAGDASCEHSEGAGHAHRDDSASASATPDTHACVITAFAQGADFSVPATLVAAPLSISAFAQRPKAEIRLARIEHLLPAGRAPPAA